MNKEVIEFIKELKEKLNKKLENYELDKAFGRLSVDSIYSLFPTESKMLLDYINQLETNIKDAIELMYDMDWNEWENGAEIRIQQILERGKE